MIDKALFSTPLSLCEIQQLKNKSLRRALKRSVHWLISRYLHWQNGLIFNWYGLGRVTGELKHIHHFYPKEGLKGI